MKGVECEDMEDCWKTIPDVWVAYNKEPTLEYAG